MGRRGVLHVVVAFALVVAMSACGNDDSSSSSTTAGRENTLEGVDWVLVDVAELAPDASGAVTARFEDGTVAGQSACNQYRAPYRIDGAGITIGPEIASTAKACEPGPMAAERAYQTRLTEVTSFRVVGDELTLTDDAGTTLLTFRASDGGDIVGSWEATGFYTGNAIESVRAGATLTARFTTDEVSGNGGCNRFSGPARTNRDAITIGPLASTLAACADPELSTQEQQYTAALEAARTFSIAGDRLQLFREDGGIAVTFDRAAGDED
jgi:heat shock protein HslJ